MEIAFIAAMSENRVIGYQGRLPWGYLPHDLENLYHITEGYPMIMGRKSYDTPDRVWSRTAPNLVVTRQPDFPLEEGFMIMQSIEAALKWLTNQGFKKIFIIGGANIFAQTLHLADYIYLTLVRGVFEGDAFFPEIDPSVFELVRERNFKKDERHAFDYSFLLYKNKKNVEK